MSDIHIYIDGDACPVRGECYKVAERHNVPVSVVSNSFLRVPKHPLFKAVIVSDGFDAADDYIAERASQTSVVITSDILLAERCLKNDAFVIKPNGTLFTKDNIGGALAMRAIMTDLRDGAEQPNFGGPPPFSARDRSEFLQSLHTVLEKMKRG